MASMAEFVIAIRSLRVETLGDHAIGATEMDNWVRFFDTWAAPPSQTELDERERTEKQVRQALEAWPAVERRNFRVFVKGSYHSGTNVRRGSDVDLAVELLGATPTDLSFITAREFSAKGMTNAQLGIVAAPPEYSTALGTFKDDCLDALNSAFGSDNVTRQNKCIEISEKSTTLPADVVPCTTYRRYDSERTHHDGIEISPDRGPVIVNWPVQTNDNGVAKNTRTSRRYKRVVRGLKALENQMAIAGAPETSSWLIECLVYNVPDSEFSSTGNYANALTTVLWLQKALSATAGQGEWLEVNELKYLFGPAQPWSLPEAIAFTSRTLRELTS